MSTRRRALMGIANDKKELLTDCYTIEYDGDAKLVDITDEFGSTKQTLDPKHIHLRYHDVNGYVHEDIPRVNYVEYPVSDTAFYTLDTNIVNDWVEQTFEDNVTYLRTDSFNKDSIAKLEFNNINCKLKNSIFRFDYLCSTRVIYDSNGNIDKKQSNYLEIEIYTLNTSNNYYEIPYDKFIIGGSDSIVDYSIYDNNCFKTFTMALKSNEIYKVILTYHKNFKESEYEYKNSILNEVFIRNYCITDVDPSTHGVIATNTNGIDSPILNSAGKYNYEIIVPSILVDGKNEFICNIFGVRNELKPYIKDKYYPKSCNEIRTSFKFLADIEINIIKTIDIGKVANGKNLLTIDNYGLATLNLDKNNMTNELNNTLVSSHDKNIRRIYINGFGSFSSTTMCNLFQGLSNLITIRNLKNLTIESSDLNQILFSECNKLINIDISSIQLSSNMTQNHMFNQCYSLINIDITKFNYSSNQVLYTDISNIFKDCKQLTYLDLSNWDLNNLTTTMSAFQGCTSLKEIKFNLNTNFNKLTDITQMFSGCSNLERIIHGPYIFKGVTSYQGTFRKCTKLCFDLFIDTTVTPNNYKVMFEKCASVPNSLIKVFEMSSNGTPLVMSDIIKDSGTSSTIVNYTSPTNKQPVKSITFIGKENPSDAYIIEYTNNEATFFGKGDIKDGFTLKDISTTITTVTFNSENKLTPTNMKAWFKNHTSLYKIDGNFLNTEYVTDISEFFSGCTTLRVINNMNSWNLSRVEDMSYMFYNCSNLGTLGLKFPTGSCKNMSHMLDGCSKVNKFDIVLDTRRVTDMSYMFYGCSNLRSETFTFDVDTSNVTTMWCMFYGCSQLTAIDFNYYDTSKVVTMARMFMNCTNLQSIKLTKLNTSKVNDFSSMFNSCRKLTSLDLTSFDTSNATIFGNMFYDCNLLSNLEQYFDFSNAVYIDNMFAGCDSLITKLRFNMKFSNLADYSGLFTNCAITSSANVEIVYDKNCLTLAECNTLVSSKVATSKITISGAYYQTKMYKLSLTATEEVVTYLYSDGFMEFDGNGDAPIYTDRNLIPYYQDKATIKEINFRVGNTIRSTNLENYFNGLAECTKICLTNLDTSNVTDMSSMFYGCKNLVNLNLNNFNTSNVTDMYAIFCRCESLTNLDVSNFDTSKVINMSAMFSMCYNLTNLNVSNFNTSNVINISTIFNDCPKLTNLDVSNFDTSNITDMSSMFYRCSSLTSLDLSNFDTSNVTDMSDMFRNNSGLTNLNISNFDTSNVTDMYYMFSGCSGLTNLNISNFDTSNVTNVYAMFSNCTSLANLNLSSFNTNKVTDIRSMFSDCPNLLTTITINKYISSVSSLFSNAATNPNSKIIVNYTNNVINIDEIIATKSSNSNVVKGTLIQSVKVINIGTPVATDATATLYSDGLLEINGTGDIDPALLTDKTATKVIVKKGNTLKPTNTSFLFSSFTNCVYMDLSNFDTSNVTDMNGMFYQCTSLTSLDLSNFNTSNVTDMVIMFAYSLKLTSLDLSNFDTSKAINIASMFDNCTSLTSIDLSNFDTSNVTDMNGMFNRCSSLTNLNLSNFKTTNTTKMNAMFTNCSSLTSLDLSNFDTSNVTDMRGMFSFCFSLTSLDLSNFDTSNVTSMNGMFDNCRNLINLNVSNLNTSNVTDMSYMFRDCAKLTSLDVSNLNTSNVTNMRDMFEACRNLINLDLKYWDVSKVTMTTYMFNNCTNLTNLNLDYWVLNSIDNASYMFNDCRKLSTSITFKKRPLSFISIFGGTCASDNGGKEIIVNYYLSAMTQSQVNDIINTKGANSAVTIGDSITPKYTYNIGYYNEAYATATLYSDGLLEFDGTGDMKHYNNTNLPEWHGNSNVKFVNFKENNTLTPTNLSYYFNDTYSTIEYIYFSNLDTSLTTDMSNMINTGDSYGIEFLDVSNLNTSKVTNMSNMISSYGLKKIKGLENFDTSKVTNMNGMFFNCSNLTELEGIKNWNIYNVTDMSYMFCFCTNLKYLDFVKWKFNNVENTSYMFNECINFTILNKYMYLPNCINVEYMFNECNFLDGVITLPKVTNATKAFNKVAIKSDINVVVNYGSTNKSIIENSINSAITANSNCHLTLGTEYKLLETFNLEANGTDGISGWLYSDGYLDIYGDSGTIKTYTSGNTPWMASYKDVIKVVKLSGTTGNFTNISYLFADLPNLISAYIYDIDWSVVTNISHLFHNCHNLKYVEFDKDFLNTSNITDMSHLFRNCHVLPHIDISNFDTSNVTNMDCMFYRCNKLTELDVAKLNVSKVTTMDCMFYVCNNLTSLDVSNWNTSKLTTMRHLFSNCYKLANLDLSNFDTSKVTDMESTFSRCYGLTNLDLSNFNTSKVTKMNGTFFYCNGLTNLDVSNFDTSNVTTMDNMFAYCNKLTTLDISNFNTNKVTLMYNMFDNCTKLDTLDLSRFNTNNVTDISYMFNWCTNLTTITGLEKWNVSNVKKIIGLFNTCKKLTNINGIFNWSINNIPDMSLIFNECTALTNIDIRKWDASNTTNLDYIFNECNNLVTLKMFEINCKETVSLTKAFYNCKKIYSLVKITSMSFADVTDAFTNAGSESNYLVILCNLSSLPEANRISLLEAQRDNTDVYIIDNWTYVKDFDLSKSSSDNVNARLTENGVLEFSGNGDIKTGTVNEPNPWYNTEYQNLIYKVQFTKNNLIRPTSLSNLFNKTTNLKYFDFNYLNTSKNTSLSYTFANLPNLELLDVSLIDTTNVTDFFQLFYNCENLETIIGLENWNTSKIERMYGVFDSCKKLIDLNLSNWNTDNVANMYAMFSECSNLNSIIGLETFNTNKVINMAFMFSNCSKLNRLDFSSFNTSNVTNMSSMFKGCINLTKISNLYYFDTSNVANMSSMFNGCSKLTSISGASSWDTSNVTNMSYMFNGCINLTRLDSVLFFNTSKVTNLNHMFNGCSTSTSSLPFRILNPNCTYEGIFENTTCFIYLNYTSNTESIVDNIISTNTNKRISKGKLIQIYDDSTIFINLSTDPLTKDDFNDVSVIIYNNGLLDIKVTGPNPSIKWVYNIYNNVNPNIKFKRIHITNDLNKSKIKLIQSTNFICSKATIVEEIIGLDLLDTSEVTDLSLWFMGVGMDAKHLLDIETQLNTWNVSNFTTLDITFQDANIKSLNLNKWRNNKITTFTNVFLGSNIKYLNLQSFTLGTDSVSRATAFNSMGYLEYLVLPNKIITSNNTPPLFNYCPSLISIINNDKLFSTMITKDNAYSYLFKGCIKLSKLNIPRSFCNKYNISNGDFSLFKDQSFAYCWNLNAEFITYKFNSQVNNSIIMNGTFIYCNNLKLNGLGNNRILINKEFTIFDNITAGYTDKEINKPVKSITIDNFKFIYADEDGYNDIVLAVDEVNKVYDIEIFGTGKLRTNIEIISYYFNDYYFYPDYVININILSSSYNPLKLTSNANKLFSYSQKVLFDGIITGLGTINGDNVQTLNSAFYNAGFKYINLGFLKNAKIREMNYFVYQGIFVDAPKLPVINLVNFDILNLSKLVTVEAAFYNTCINYIKLDSMKQATNVKIFKRFFAAPDLSSYSYFDFDKSRKYIIDMSPLNFNNCTDISFIFWNQRNIKGSIDLLNTMTYSNLSFANIKNTDSNNKITINYSSITEPMIVDMFNNTLKDSTYVVKGTKID